MSKKSDLKNLETNTVINTADIQRYFETIDRCAKTKENLPISNGNARHATYLIGQFFKYAQSEVCILSGSFYEGVYNSKELIHEAINFLKKDSKHRLRIAYQYKVSQEEILGRQFIKDIKDNPERKGGFEVWDSSDCSKGISHFAVMDKSGFRFETDSTKRSGVANFGDLESGKILAEIFDRIVAISRQVLSLPPLQPTN